ncbi:Zinc finger protein [Pseudolycoriella hygida]|uniref:Zinc finger protein n=1 Tax=Pseudolycoriella hygida TaxID=35572 RepID=A0A9Q0N8R8_9DIPT|nr:Zinc finger protein [Pseudolycoriella hygida]
MQTDSHLVEETGSTSGMTIKVEPELHLEDQDSEIQSSQVLDEDSSSSENEFYKNVTEKQRKAALKHNECFICKKRLKSFAAFKRHVMTHINAKKFKCHLCEKQFSEARYLADHFLVHSGNPHTCHICQKNFANSRSLLGHIRIHTGEKRYKCKVCDKAFTESSTRTKHMATHSTEHPFKCNLCDKAFSRKSNLQRHAEIHVREQMKLTIDEFGQECPICFKNITGDFKRHVKYHEKADSGADRKYSCEVCGASYNLAANLQAHMWRHTGKKEFTCDICSKEFSHISNIKKHMKIHSGDKKFVCHLCPKAFVMRSLLQRHLRTHSVERKEKNFLCDLCSKSFTERGSLNFHLLTHAGVKPHVCKECPKAFYTKSLLQKHQKLRLPEKTFRCGYCHSAFSRKRSLVLHMISHHTKVDVKGEGERFTCEICPTTFKTMKRLRCHRKEHSNLGSYNCEFCPKVFSNFNKLETHVENLHTPKFFNCTFCLKAFSSSERLHQHSEKHISEKLLSPCTICHKVFDISVNMERHIAICQILIGMPLQEELRTANTSIEHGNTLNLSQKRVKPHVCKECPKAFYTKSLLQKHQNVHLPEKPFRCGYCPSTFSHKRSLVLHLISHDTKVDVKGEGERFTCEICPATFTTMKHLRCHRKEHSNLGSYNCEFCPKAFSNFNKLESHVENLHTPKFFNCTSCSEAFSSSERVEQHCEKHISEKLLSPCTICHKVFHFSVNMESHIARCQNLIGMPLQEELRTANTSIEHGNTLNLSPTFYHRYGVKPHVCKECPKAFYTKSLLQKHQKLRLPEKTFRCGYCHSAFSRKRSLVLHMISHHTKVDVKGEGERFTCEICPTTFKTMKRLRCHRKEHSNLGSYNCEFCPKAFSNFNKLETHVENLHTPKFFNCTDCSEAFSSSERLHQHSEKHILEKRLSPCTICHKVFDISVNMERHIAICQILIGMPLQEELRTANTSIEHGNTLNLSQKSTTQRSVKKLSKYP